RVRQRRHGGELGRDADVYDGGDGEQRGGRVSGDGGRDKLALRHENAGVRDAEHQQGGADGDGRCERGDGGGRPLHEAVWDGESGSEERRGGEGRGRHGGERGRDADVYDGGDGEQRGGRVSGDAGRADLGQLNDHG